MKTEARLKILKVLIIMSAIWLALVVILFFVEVYYPGLIRKVIWEMSDAAKNIF